MTKRNGQKMAHSGSTVDTDNREGELWTLWDSVLCCAAAVTASGLPDVVIKWLDFNSAEQNKSCLWKWIEKKKNQISVTSNFKSKVMRIMFEILMDQFPLCSQCLRLMHVYTLISSAEHYRIHSTPRLTVHLQVKVNCYIHSSSSTGQNKSITNSQKVCDSEPWHYHQNTFVMFDFNC